jgi:hypothetical protein
MRQAGNLLTLHPTLARAFALTTAAACLAAAAPALAGVANATTATTAEPATTTTATATATTTATADAAPPAVYGLFPLWEHTGVVEESGAARVGLRHTQVGLGPVTVGTDPYLDFYGTMNATAKLGLVRSGPLRLALQASWLRVPTAAETRGVGNLHAGAFANPYAPVTLLPVAAGVTWLAARLVHLHASATLLQTLSAAPELQTTSAGISAWVEWWTPSGRSVRLHAGAEGWPVAPQQHVGLSFGWRTRYAALQGGYARRFAVEGTGANTVMFDGAVVFP